MVRISKFALPLVLALEAGGMGWVKVPHGISWGNNAYPDMGPEDDIKPYFFIEVDLFGCSEGERELCPNKVSDLVRAGHLVFCYLSTGSIEEDRPDSMCKLGRDHVESCKFNEDIWKVLGSGSLRRLAGNANSTRQLNVTKDWGEVWLDITKLDLLKQVMGPRFDLAKTLGCHGVEPDNIDCYQNRNCQGFGHSDAQLAYNKWQIEKAHSLGLAIAQKNNGGFYDLSDHYDLAIVEQGEDYDDFDTFEHKNKAVLIQEYGGGSKKCSSHYSLNYCEGDGSDDCAAGEGITMHHCVTTGIQDITCTSGSYDKSKGSCTADGRAPSPEWCIMALIGFLMAWR